jgi:predicted nucleotidyltransferase
VAFISQPESTKHRASLLLATCTTQQFLGVDLQTGNRKQAGGLVGVNQQAKITLLCVRAADNRPKDGKAEMPKTTPPPARSPARTRWCWYLASGVGNGKLVWEAMAAERAPIFKTPAAGDPALAEAVLRLVQAYNPDRIYLFGSVARGDAGADSDYDLLLVVPDDAPPEKRRSRLAYEALRGTGTAADVLVCTRSYFEGRRSLKASLPGTVLRDGRLLHAA